MVLRQLLNVHDILGENITIRISLFSYTQKKKQYEKYKLKSYIMKKESLSIIVSYINVIVNQTDTYKI